VVSTDQLCHFLDSVGSGQESGALVLSEADIVGTRRESKQIFYRLTEEKAARLVEALHGVGLHQRSRGCGACSPVAALDGRSGDVSVCRDRDRDGDEDLGAMSNRLRQILAALASGSIFGFGLSLSGMLNPARVRGFLDIGGNWDPSLAFVLAGAVSVMMAATFLSRRMRRPVFEDAFHMPTSKQIDGRLIFGSAIFGVGWGMAGFCPGPAIASLTLGLAPVFLFVGAMVLGMTVHDRIVQAGTAQPLAVKRSQPKWIRPGPRHRSRDLTTCPTTR
jgi:uncharacterized membrane protein YedE/YeeE